MQKTEQPARKREGVDSYEERTGKGDDVLTSPELNRDTEIFGTEVGVADAMRFQVTAHAEVLAACGDELPHSGQAVACSQTIIATDMSW